MGRILLTLSLILQAPLETWQPEDVCGCGKRSVLENELMLLRRPAGAKSHRGADSWGPGNNPCVSFSSKAIKQEETSLTLGRANLLFPSGLQLIG